MESSYKFTFLFPLCHNSKMSCMANGVKIWYPSYNKIWWKMTLEEDHTTSIICTIIITYILKCSSIYRPERTLLFFEWFYLFCTDAEFLFFITFGWAFYILFLFYATSLLQQLPFVAICVLFCYSRIRTYIQRRWFDGFCGNRTPNAKKVSALRLPWNLYIFVISSRRWVNNSINFVSIYGKVISCMTGSVVMY